MILWVASSLITCVMCQGGAGEFSSNIYIWWMDGHWQHGEVYQHSIPADFRLVMMTTLTGNIFHITSPLCEEFTDHQWIPFTKASEAVLLMFSLMCTWTNSWVNNRDATDLKHYHTHCDVTVMCMSHSGRWFSAKVDIDVSCDKRVPETLNSNIDHKDIPADYD